MAGLTLNNLSAEVAEITKRTDKATQIQNAILQRANCLLHLDEWPFARAYKTFTMTTDEFRYALPSAFAIPQGVTIWTSGDERTLNILEQNIFDHMFPKPDERSNDKPAYCCIKNDEIWFDRGADTTYDVRLDFYYIPHDATLTGVSAELTELAKLALVRYASADIFYQIGSREKWKEMKEEGSEFILALKNRYMMVKERDAGFISPTDAWDYVSRYFPDDEWKRLGW